MTRPEKIYTSLCVLFSVLIITGNLTYQKFVYLHFLYLYKFELSAAVIFYPLTFLITDLITEFYGKEKANFCVLIGITMNSVVALSVIGLDSMHATEWSKVDNDTFHLVFGLYSVAFIGSMIACYISQRIDIILYLWIKKRTSDKMLWLRNNGSTAISLLIDTSIVVSFITLSGAIPVDKMLPLIINSYSFKLLFTLCSTPLFYLSVWTIKKLQGQKQTV
jgi:uncharacterized integral membrane protein (TIGR00697 family)